MGYTFVPWLKSTGISLTDYPKLTAWCDRLMTRPAWQKTEAMPEAIETLKTRMAATMASN